MNSTKRMVWYLVMMILGSVLMGLEHAERLDPFWGSMGFALMCVSVLRLLQWYRFCKDESYREKQETEAKDERNQFIRSRAWTLAGSLFILIASVAVIILRVIGQNLLSVAASYAVCLMLVLYWGTYMILRRKY